MKAAAEVTLSAAEDTGARSSIKPEKVSVSISVADWEKAKGGRRPGGVRTESDDGAVIMEHFIPACPSWNCTCISRGPSNPS